MTDYDEASSTGDYWNKRAEENAEMDARPMSIYEMEGKRDMAKRQAYELKEEYRGEYLAEAAKWDQRIADAQAKGQVV